jgi:hypothetical protein
MPDDPAARRHAYGKEQMNRTSKLRGFLRGMTMLGLVGATASSAGAQETWTIQYCNGHYNNNLTTVSGSGCETPRSVDCWEDPAHNPPQYGYGDTYARTQVRVCNGTVQVRAYAFGDLKAKSQELGGNFYFALAEAYNSSGTSVGSQRDESANGSYSGWKTVASTAYSVRSLGYVAKYLIIDY